MLIGVGGSAIPSKDGSDVGAVIIREMRTQIIYSMFENNELLKTIGHDHRLKIIEGMNFREFSKDESVFFKFRDRGSKLVFCLHGQLVSSDNTHTAFLKQG